MVIGVEECTSFVWIILLPFLDFAKHYWVYKYEWVASAYVKLTCFVRIGYWVGLRGKMFHPQRESLHKLNLGYNFQSLPHLTRRRCQCCSSGSSAQGLAARCSGGGLCVIGLAIERASSISCVHQSRPTPSMYKAKLQIDKQYDSWQQQPGRDKF